MAKNLLILFFIGHLLGDFYFQSNHLAKNKNESFLSLLNHGLIYSLSIAVVLIPVFGFSFIKWTFIVSLIHLIIDGAGFYLHQQDKLESANQNKLYLLDQFVHFASILILSLFILSTSNQMYYTRVFQKLLENPYIDIQLFPDWVLAIGLIIKPASITINKMLAQYQPTTVSEEERGHPGAGSLIGILERLIILFMLSQNQYAAIGFVLTAKSIARYNKITEDPEFSEYYLLGTLLSMLLVVLSYLLIF